AGRAGPRTHLRARMGGLELRRPGARSLGRAAPARAAGAYPEGGARLDLPRARTTAWTSPCAGRDRPRRNPFLPHAAGRRGARRPVRRGGLTLAPARLRV